MEGVTQAVHKVNLYFVEVYLEPGALLPLLQHGVLYPGGRHTGSRAQEGPMDFGSVHINNCISKLKHI